MAKGLSVALLTLILIYTICGHTQEMDTLKAGVVKIIAKPDEETRKIGTGFIVHLTQDTAYIATASHVVEGDKYPQVEFFTHRYSPVSATVLGQEGGDPRGLAVLSVKGEENWFAGLRALYLAPSVELEGGDEIIVIGHPRGGGLWSVIPGNITGRVGQYILFDAEIIEGNSGGPIIKEGRVVGIVTEQRDYGYAVPVASIQLYLKGLGLTGAISVKSEPPSAQVTLDGLLRQNRTPMTIRNVMLGAHSLKLSLNGYQDWEERIDVELGKTREINAELKSQSPPPVKKGSNLKWYLIGGTIVTAGGGIAALLLSGDSGGNGDSNPETASMELSIFVSPRN